MKTTKKLIRLDWIFGVLPSVQEAYDCLAGVMPLVRDPEKFSAEMCRLMLERTPPMLVLKGDKYYLFAGYREWQLALYKLDRTEKISCQIVTDTTGTFLNEMAWNDAYGAMLLYGTSPNLMGLQCKEVVSKVPKKINDKFFPEFSSVRKFSKVTDISRASFYLKPAGNDDKKDVTFKGLLKRIEQDE